MKEQSMWLKKNGICEMRYMELKCICLQYERDKRSADLKKREKAAAVEAAARAANASLAEFILRNVTDRARYEEMPVPAGINQFFQARQRFFVELDKRVP